MELSGASLATRILAETEYHPACRPGLEGTKPGKGPGKEALRTACAILDAAISKGKAVLAYSGGADSTALLHLAAQAGIKPILVWCDTRMEYPETKAFVESQAKRYGFKLAIAQANREPTDQWRRCGWPMLGKMAARFWTTTHRDAGFTLNVTECCRQMKIKPARDLTRNLGCSVQITGQRGKADDRVRGMRTVLDGMVGRQNRDRMWIANPLTGWTDDDVAGYSAEHNLPEHPAKVRGARTIGCVYCGGGSQFENSGYRILRRSWPEAWMKFMVDWCGGLIILAIKYKARLEDVQAAVREGWRSLDNLAECRPWVFDYTRLNPLAGYAKRART